MERRKNSELNKQAENMGLPENRGQLGPKVQSLVWILLSQFLRRFIQPALRAHSLKGSVHELRCFSHLSQEVNLFLPCANLCLWADGLVQYLPTLRYGNKKGILRGKCVVDSKVLGDK